MAISLIKSPKKLKQQTKSPRQHKKKAKATGREDAIVASVFWTVNTPYSVTNASNMSVLSIALEIATIIFKIDIGLNFFCYISYYN